MNHSAGRFRARTAVAILLVLGSRLVVRGEPGATNTPPVAPTNVMPAANATNVEPACTLVSSGFSDSGRDTHAGSQWQVATDAEFTQLSYDSGCTTAHLTSVSLPRGRLKAGVIYRWRVRHQDGLGQWSPWSTPSVFTTMAQDRVRLAPPRGLRVVPTP